VREGHVNQSTAGRLLGDDAVVVSSSGTTSLLIGGDGVDVGHGEGSERVHNNS